MELWREPGIAKPEPLRIVKERAKTITGCSTPREIYFPRRRSSGTTNASGSPPEDKYGSLTICKKRRDRGSVLSDSFGLGPVEDPNSIFTGRFLEHQGIFDRPNNAILKPRQSSARTISVGSFLKSELLRGSSEGDPEIGVPSLLKQNPRRLTDAFNSIDADLFPLFKLEDLGKNPNQFSNTLERRESKGKRLMSKAVNSLGRVRSKSMHFLQSKQSNEPLVRHLSLKNQKLFCPRCVEKPFINSSRFSFERDPENCGVADLAVNLRAPSNGPQIALAPSYILYPEINIVPEVNSIDTVEGGNLWVAVLVTGVLQPTIESTLKPEANNPDTIESSRAANFGYLYDVDIKLSARSGCILETLLTEPDRSRCLQPGESELILAEIKLSEFIGSYSDSPESSTDLIAELESQLGGTVTDYLAVVVSYRHSAFPRGRHSKAASVGMPYYETTMRTESHAIIKRHCSRSSWAPQYNSDRDSKQSANPIIPLIKAHCNGTRAASLISKIALASRFSASKRRGPNFSDLDCHSSSETVIPRSDHGSKGSFTYSSQPDITQPTSSAKQSLDITQAELYDSGSSLELLTPENRNEHDPARQIWTEMRRTSRGASKRGPQTIGSGSVSAEMSLNGCASKHCEQELRIQREQTRIMDLVVKNKRSMGAETLRSIASPSAPMGLGMSRGWGWGPPWW